MLKRTILGALIMTWLFGAVGPAHAAVHVNIGINLPGPPQLVVVPGTPVLYAPAVPANYFFYEGRYYVYANDVWSFGPTYNGPWTVIAPEYVPRPLLLVPVQYYHARPRGWEHWRHEAPPRWDAKWGRRWTAQHRDGREQVDREAPRGERPFGREERREERRDERHDERHEDRARR